ncbi:MAG: pyridoxamine 5'-phosphate oxidase [Anaerolinea sp.]|nr:pyridoxamine 5'-phosphate oxidase [Anaerolinea sp.]
MADWYDHIDAERRQFIENQHVFFVATASSKPGGTVNLSPKGRNLLRVLGPNLVGYLDYPGSGNETAKHTAADGRVTLMFCSFDKTAGIVRLYGRGRAVEVDDPLVRQHHEAFGDDLHPFVRQAFFIDVEKVQTSCGYAVPRMEYVDDRETLDKWCERTTEPREFINGLPVGGELVRKA